MAMVFFLIFFFIVRLFTTGIFSVLIVEPTKKVFFLSP